MLVSPHPNFLECKDSIAHSLTDLYISCFTLFFKSALVAPTIKNGSLDHNDLDNYQNVLSLCFMAKILDKVVLSQVFILPQPTHSWHHFAAMILS